MAVGVACTPPFLQFFANNGSPLVGGTILTQVGGVNTATFQDVGLTTPFPNPIPLNSRGEVSSATGASQQLFLTPNTVYTFTLFDANGNQINVASYVNGVQLNVGAIGALIFPQTAAEASAGISPANLGYEPGNMLRYGLVPNDPTFASANTATAKTLFAYSVANGPTGDFMFPNTTGNDTYYFNDSILCRPGCHLHLNGCKLSWTKAGGTADTNGGAFFATQDFSIEDGSLVLNYTGTASFALLQFGGRDVPVTGSPLPTIFDSLLPNFIASGATMGHIRVKNVYLSSNASNIPVVQFLGGVNDVVFENVDINGQSAASYAIYGEYGWATNQTNTWQRQTSHPHNHTYRNVRVVNVNTASSGNGGIVFNGAYNIIVDGLHASSVPIICGFGSGESLFFNPWVGVDDIGSIAPNGRHVTVRNVVGRAITGNAINVNGATQANPVAGTHSGFMGWRANTTYAIGDKQFNGAGLFTCSVAGVSAASGGPTGTGSGILDGTAQWNFTSNAAPYETEQLYATVDNVDADGVAGAGGYGIFSSAGRLNVRSVKLTNFQRGIVTTDECTLYNIESATVLNSSSFGMQIGQGVDVYTTPRQSIGFIRNCFVAGSGTNGSTSAGIVAANTLSMTIEGCRFGYEAIHDNITETAQSNAVNLAASCLQVKIRNCYVAATSGGAVALAQVGATQSNGNRFEALYGVTTFSGFWDNDLETNSADRGDANVTITVGADYYLQYFKTPLTANRTVTLSTGGLAVKGSKFRIVRTSAATGAFSITVGAVKVIPTSTFAFVDVEFDGSAWNEVGYGVL